MTDDQSTPNKPATPLTFGAAEILLDPTLQPRREPLQSEDKGITVNIYRNADTSDDLPEGRTRIGITAWAQLSGDYPLDLTPVEDALRQAITAAIDEALRDMNLKIRERDLLAAHSLGHLIQIAPGEYMLTDRGREYVRANILENL